MPSDLLARLRAATGPDRELDALVWKAFSPKDEVLFDSGSWEKWQRLAARVGAPPYTASVDACLALVRQVLPGCRVHLREWKEGWDAAVISADEKQIETSSDRATPALSLLTAIVAGVEAQRS